MTIDSLVVNSVEKTLAQWGLTEDVELMYENKGKCSLRMTSTEDADVAACAFDYEQKVVLYLGRTYENGVFSGGNIVFRGWIADISRSGAGPRETISYTCYDLWWWLERDPFKQQRKEFGGWSGGVVGTPILNTVVSPEAYLGENLAEGRITNGATITEILNWCNEMRNPTRRGGAGPYDTAQDVVTPGTMDPAALIPVTRIQTIFCAEAIVTCARWTPDAVFKRDWSTDPVTLSLRSLTNQTEVTITLTAEQERQIRLAPQYTRQLTGVAIYYKRVDTEDGYPYYRFYRDLADASGWRMYKGRKEDGVIYTPPGGTGGSGAPALTDWTPDVSSHHVELMGGSVTYARAAVTVDTLAAYLVMSNVDKFDWWRQKDGSLRDDKIDDGTDISYLGPTVTHVGVYNPNTGAAINTTTYPNILRDTPLFAWMPGVVWTPAVIVADIEYDEYNDTDWKNLTKTVKRRIGFKCIMTNATSQTYSQVSSYQEPEEPVEGLAKAVYDSVSALQYSGTIDLPADSAVKWIVTNGLQIGTKLKLVGPNNTYENCIVQRIVVRPFYGSVTVEFGPSATLDASELIELARASRGRLTWEMPSNRSTGQPAEGTTVDLSGPAGGDNSSSGVPGYKYMGMVGTTPIT